MRVFRSAEPLRYYDCSVAKNTAHMATQALTGKFPPECLYVVNVDNDNIITQQFCLDVLETALAELGAGIQQPSQRVATQWNSKDLGTFGRIGMPWLTFLRVGGYDQGMKGMGAQDTDIMWRLGLVGRVEKKQVLWSGLSVPNQENKADELLTGNDKDRRKVYEDEKAEKMKNLDPLVVAEFQGSFKAMNTHNRARAEANWRGKRWRVNEDLVALGVPAGESDLKHWLRQVYGSPSHRLEVSGALASAVATGGSASSTTLQPASQAGVDRQGGLAGRQAGVDRQCGVRPLVQPQLVASMGTRTLTYSYPGNAGARQMQETMWPRNRQYVGGRKTPMARPELDLALATRAVTACGDELSQAQGIAFVDCTRLSGFTGEPAFDAQGHVGRHEQIQAAYVRHQRFPDIVSELVTPVQSILAGTRMAVVFWCNAGEHRSVACAEMFCRWLAAVLPPTQGAHCIRHLCASEWTRRGCGNCSRCRERGVLTESVDQAFAAEMNSRPAIRQALTATT